MITVVKIGGNVVDNPEALGRFVTDFAKLPGKKILIHGGGKEATRLSARLGIETTMIDGRRVTSRETLDVVTMVYAGLVNKRIVAALQAAGCNAIGLSGADAAVITATKRPAAPVDYGFVGDIDPAKINSSFIDTLLSSGIVPVFCAITHDGNGSLLNCNADSVASAVAIAASRIDTATLVFCFEKNGVLADVDNPDSVIPAINRANYSALRADGTVSKGMIPKIDNAFAAIDAGVDSVTIKHSDNLLSNSGTTITA
ncbi:MAG: acetylglutamate kinase [Muribaculaceae bacterium]|nr:acetylglutamate kinase [Muribaculaceae bacterium]